MIQYEHRNYDQYVAVQRRMTERKTQKGRKYFSWCDEDMMKEVNDIIHQYVDKIEKIVCHGCRCGTEVDVLQKLNPQAKVYGTDIYGNAYAFDRTYFREMDFDTVPEEWKEYFDVIYCNCIDHSRDPINTLLGWKSELRDGGISFVTFYWGRGISKEDCFHLDDRCPELDIKDLANRVGMEIQYISSPYIDRWRNCLADVVCRKSM